MAVSKAEVIKLSRPGNEVDGIVRSDSTFVDLMKAILTFAFAFEKEHNENFVATNIVDIVEDVLSSEFLTKISAKSY